MKSTLPPNLRVVITGAAGGLGRAFAVELASRGARIVVSDIVLEGCQETVELIKTNGGDAIAVTADVADWSSVQALENTANGWLGGIDLLINNAGVAVRGDVESVSLEDWDWIMGINLWGVIHGCRAFLPAMKKRGTGFIINVASAAGLLSSPRLGPYNVTKAAVVSLSETLYTELVYSDVNITVLCPAFFKTNILASGRGPKSEKTKRMNTETMERSKVQAPDVAKFALQKVAEGELYALPMKDVNWAWRLKRFAPSLFYRKIAAPKRRR